MRYGLLAALILSVAASRAFAAGPSGLHKRISVEYGPATLGGALADIEQKTGVRIACDDETLKGMKPVSLKAANKTAGRILTGILRRRGLKLRFDGANQVTVIRHNWYTPLTKKEEVYEFVQKPTVRNVGGDAFEIMFETKGYCDCTIAIEDQNGKILRHLASGVLGVNTPEPFVWNSKKQVVPWDGKDDFGEYVARDAEDYKNITVRVSLGLKARLERTLFWAPHKRAPGINHKFPALISPAPEGVYVYDGAAGDHVKLFDRKGDYVRSVFPFPADNVAKVRWPRLHPKSTPERPVPLKWNPDMCEALTFAWTLWGHPKGGWPTWKCGATWANVSDQENAASAFAVHGKRIALVRARLNRLATDGTSGGLSLQGPDTWIPGPAETRRGFYYQKAHAVSIPPKLSRSGKWERGIPPSSIAFSPDGKWLYATGYIYYQFHRRKDALPVVTRMAYEGTGGPELWVGSFDPEASGAGDRQFRFPTALAVDSKGRVYVCDYANSRVQVFSPDAKLLKSLKTPYPVEVEIDPKTGECFVFSFAIGNHHFLRDKPKKMIKSLLTRYSAYPAFRKGATYSLPDPSQWPRNVKHLGNSGPDDWRDYAVDFHTDPPTLWNCQSHKFYLSAHPAKPVRSREGDDATGRGMWRLNIRLYEIGEKELKLKRDFFWDVQKEAVLWRDPSGNRMRVHVDPKRGDLWVHSKGFDYLLVRIDPETGKETLIKSPFPGLRELTFDAKGLFYGRTKTAFARFEPTGSGGWREVPYDYGESMTLGKTRVRAGIPTPMNYRGARRSFQGFGVSPGGRVVFSEEFSFSKGAGEPSVFGTKPYQPPVLPGRGGRTLVWVFDKYGKLAYDDALPGGVQNSGARIDSDDNLYIQLAGLPCVNGKVPPNLNMVSCSIIKARAGRCRIVKKKGQVENLPKDRLPRRPRDLMMAQRADQHAWIDGAEWIYPEVGITGVKGQGPCFIDCVCSVNSRFDLDTYARTFASEVHLYRVVVLDTNGNVILRVGRMGNVDDGMPLVKDGKPPHPRSIGGDEVAIMNCLQLAVHTDRRLFISDIGNYCIRSVKLGYHASERVPAGGPHRTEAGRAADESGNR
jgi:hypothetical protein